MTQEYYIIGKQGDNRYNFNKLDQSELEAIEQSCEILYKFGYYDKRETEIKENLKEFLKVYEYAEGEIKTKTDSELRDGVYNLIFININRTFTNYLSSYKIQIDNFDIHLKNKYGRKSTEYQKFDKHKKMIYDTNFTHRLFYNLRNYSQHIYFPINHISKNSEKVGQGMEDSMLIAFDKKRFLGDDFLIKKIGTDLEKCNDFVPVMVHINNSQKIIEDIYKMYMIIEQSSLTSHADLINKYTSVVPFNMQPLYGYWEHITPTTGACRTTIFPMDLVDKLYKKLNEFCL